MKQNFIIRGLRGSVFMPQMTFNWEFISAIQTMLPNYIPSVISDTPQVIKGMLLSPGDWILSSPDDNIRIVFQAQKVDYIINTNIEYTQDIVSTLANNCNQIFKRIMEITGMRASRLAIAPTLEYKGDTTLFKNFVNKIYAKNTFKESKVDNCDFSQVFRVDEEINGKQFIVNYLSKFYVATPIVVVNGINTIQEVNMVDFDINTFVNPEYSFDTNATSDFFQKGAGFCSEFLLWYIGE